MAGWGPPLRIARRTARRSVGRTLLVAALIGVPVFAASFIGLLDRAGNPTGETLAQTEIGTADARLTVTSYPKLNPWPERPTLYGVESGPPSGVEELTRDTRKIDPLKFLPPGSTTAHALRDSGTVDLRGPQANSKVKLITGDGLSKLAEGSFKLDSGQMPGKPAEVAISPSLAKYLELLDGDGKLKAGATLTAANEQKYAVVGLARTFQSPAERTVFAAANSSLYAPDQLTRLTYLADLPNGTDADALSDQLLANGLMLLPRANIVDPPPTRYGSPTDAGATAVMTLIVGFGVLEIVLLAGTAFAVGARRQTRELGLVIAAGGTPRDVRRIVLAQGFFTGAIGAGGGLLLAIILAIAGRPLWEKLLSTLFVGAGIPWGMLLPVATLGLLAGLAAAVVPAISAGRQTPMAALSGRFAAARGKPRLRKPAVIMVGAGIACTIAGSIWMGAALDAARKLPVDPALQYRATVTPTNAIALVLLGITAVILGLVWLLPNLVAKVAQVAKFLPLSGRLALRDAARHRHRTGPAAAAIMMSVAATAALAFAISNSIASEAADYAPDSRPGDAVLPFGPIVPYSPVTVEKVAGLLPVKKTYPVSDISLVGAETSGDYTPALHVKTPPKDGQWGYPLMVVDPAYVARFPDYGPKAAAAMRTGKVVVPDELVISGGMVELVSGSDIEYKSTTPFPGILVTSPPKAARLFSSALISPEVAKTLGNVTPYQAVYELTREPTDAELASVAKLLGHEDVLKVEKGYQSPARQWFLGLMGVATVVTLLGVAISVSLSAAEGRADLATLAAVGAPPRRRRNLAAAQAWVLGQLGCLLGVGVGALYGYTAHAAFGSPHLAIPWQEIGGIVILVPLFAGLLAWLMTRSRLPMVSRVD